jgi:DNA-3-methyladenine glycosylase I
MRNAEKRILVLSSHPTSSSSAPRRLPFLSPENQAKSKHEMKFSALSGTNSIHMPTPKEKTRCHWAKSDLMARYHDDEWGVPLHDDQKLFEFLILEGAQAGLSWETVLNKRENYRKAYDGFDPEIVAKYGARKVKQLLNNPGIIRNRLKVAASITNAKNFLKVQKEFGSFDKYIWQFVNGKPKINTHKTTSTIPATSPESDVMSADLKKRGFKFVGSTICYAHMQATGMVNDHLVTCWRRR